MNGQNPAGPGIFELLLLAALIFLVFRLLRTPSKDRRDRDQTGGRTDAPAPDQRDAAPPRARFTLSDDPWDRLRSKPKQTTPPAPPGVSGKENVAANTSPGLSQARTPPDLKPLLQPAPAPVMNDDDFLRGAKMAYTRITASLVEDDFEDLVQFCSQKALGQLAAAPKNPAEASLVSARLVEQKQLGDRLYATVSYQLLERPRDGYAARERQATWLFGKPAADANATWLLDEILG